MSGSQTTYNDKVVRQFAVMTVIWGIVGMLVGVIIAAQLVWPELNIGFLHFGRLRPLHTNAVIFAFGGNALICTSFWIVQRTCKARLFGGVLPWFVFWGYQLFIVLAATLNFGFVIGDISDPSVHNPYELFAAIVVNLIATVLKFGDRTQMGAVHLATSLVADLQLVAAGVFWVVASQAAGGMSGSAMASVVSLAAGALLANIVSVILLIAETLQFSRR